MKFGFVILLALCSTLNIAASTSSKPSDKPAVDWLDSDQLAFAKARAEGKPILLYLEAVWCHWCHVMDHKTYSNEAVISLLNKHFITLKIDQDARPDLANRYRDYGWPATIFFTKDGVDMVKRAGYIPPRNMKNLLMAILADPSPEAGASISLIEKALIEKAQKRTALSNTLRQKLIERHTLTFDTKLGGLKSAIKFIERDSLEYALYLARAGNEVEAERAKLTLDAALNLFDPIWGGVYQYSTGYSWDNQHYEKLASIQASYLRIYSLAYAQFGNPAYLSAMESILSYLHDFLMQDDGAFYTSQDADLVQGEHSAFYFDMSDENRRRLGVPRVDKNSYTNDNGAIIEALCAAFEATGHSQYLNMARQTINWVIQNRSTKAIGFQHSESVDRFYLSDNLAMGRTFLAMYRVTAEKSWLLEALKLNTFISTNFPFKNGGYATAEWISSPIQPLPQLDENISLARFSNLLYQFSGDAGARKVAAKAMSYITSEEVALSRVTEAGILLAEAELSKDPLHITIVGKKSNARANELFQSVLRLPGWYKRIEWWDRSEGKLTNPDVTYPNLNQTSAFVCTENKCSVPLFSTVSVKTYLKR